MCFFKQYALQKLIAQSGKLDAVQNLLLIYDTTNLGMVKLIPEIQKITEKCLLLKSEEARIEQELSNADDFVKAMRSQRERRKELKEKDKAVLSQMSSVTIDNNLLSDINDENLQIFRATLDIPEV